MGSISKICNKCGETKDLDSFYSRKRKDGSLRYDCACKVCRINEKSVWQKENPDIVSRWASIRYRRNPDKYKNQSWEWRNTHPEIRARIQKNYAMNHPISREKNLEYCNAYRSRKRNAEGRFTSEEWIHLCDGYGNICLCCKRSNVKLIPDHVVPLSKGGTNWISNIQPLCNHCNSVKHDRIIDYRR